MDCSRMEEIQLGPVMLRGSPTAAWSRDPPGAQAGLQEPGKALGYHRCPLGGTGCLHRHSTVDAQAPPMALVCFWPL